MQSEAKERLSQELSRMLEGCEVTFSRWCISGLVPDCACSRCLRAKGVEPTEESEAAAEMRSKDETHVFRARTLASLRNSEHEFLHELTAMKLLEHSVRNARSRQCRKGKKHPRWVGVMDCFALGSTYSKELCEKFGLNPEEEVSR